MKKCVIFLMLFSIGYFLNAQDKQAKYSFFTAGHTYGSPYSPHYGLHYPFVDFIPFLNNNPNMELGFLTGDLVYYSTHDYWDSIMLDIDKFDFPIYVAAGNHDMGPEFIERFGEYYYSFINKNDLFIVLTPGLDSWNISGDQLDFLKSELDNNYRDVNNIFIFMHELIWWSPTNKYNYVKINYEPYYPGHTNYLDEIKPLLLSYPNSVTIYAGDLGATNTVSSFMYHHFDNITLIGSGMGNGQKDNIIITHVYDDSIYYDLVALNGPDQNALGEIYDYHVLGAHTIEFSTNIDIYPNPCDDYLNIRNRSLDDYKVTIYDSRGDILFEELLKGRSVLKLNVARYNSGVYLLKLNGKKTLDERKVIIN